MPALKKVAADNPMTGAGIIRYFDVEEGIKIDPMIFIGLTIAFIIFEIVLQMVG